MLYFFSVFFPHGRARDRLILWHELRSPMLIALKYSLYFSQNFAISMAEVLFRTWLLTPCNVLCLIAWWIWIRQLSKQDPSFIPTWPTWVVQCTRLHSYKIPPIITPATAAGISCAKVQESHCLLHPDWMNSLASSNQRGVTAWLQMNFQNVTKKSFEWQVYVKRFSRSI